MKDSNPIDDKGIQNIIKNAIKVLHEVKTDEDLVGLMHGTVKAVGDNIK